MDKESFKKAWDEHIEPMFSSGALEWECSPSLEKYLLEKSKPKRFEEEMWSMDNMSNDELWEDIQAGRV